MSEDESGKLKLPMNTFILFLHEPELMENVCREWRCAVDLASTWCGGSSEVAVKPHFKKKTKKKNICIVYGLSS